MSETHILNPATGRMVKVDGAIGKRLMQEMREMRESQESAKTQLDVAKKTKKKVQKTRTARTALHTVPVTPLLIVEQSTVPSWAVPTNIPKKTNRAKQGKQGLVHGFPAAELTTLVHNLHAEAIEIFNPNGNPPLPTGIRRIDETSFEVDFNNDLNQVLQFGLQVNKKGVLVCTWGPECLTP